MILASYSYSSHRADQSSLKGTFKIDFATIVANYTHSGVFLYLQEIRSTEKLKM